MFFVAEMSYHRALPEEHNTTKHLTEAQYGFYCTSNVRAIYLANMEREVVILGIRFGISNYIRLTSNFLCFLSESLEDKCQKMACECDREAAKCFSKAPYHTKFLLWPDFLCGEIQPLCRY